MSEQQHDIVQRLSGRPATTPADQSLLADAADTITALRAELSRLQAGGQGVEPAARDQGLPLEWQSNRDALLAYVLQDDLHNRLTPRVIDIAYTAFLSGATGKNKDDGGRCDWFNDTKPAIVEAINKLRKDLFDATPAHPPAAPAQSCPEACRTVEKCCNFGCQKQPAAPAPYLDQLIGDLLMPLPAFTARELQSLHRRAAEMLQLSRPVNANKHPPAPALVPLTRIDELAKVYAKSYASPHHFTIDCEGIRKIINGLTVGGDGGA